MGFKTLKAEHWTNIEHWAFWIAIILAVLSIIPKEGGWLAWLCSKI
jgi:hypothetical protein